MVGLVNRQGDRGTRFWTPRSSPKAMEQVSPTLCNVQFWLLVSKGNRLKALTFLDLLTLRMVWFTQADPSSTSLKLAVVSTFRSALGIASIRLARAVLAA